MVGAGDTAQVVVLDADRDPAVIGTTEAWNWQQGARQQWFSVNGEDGIVYNDLDGGLPVSRVWWGGEVATHACSVFDVSNLGEALCVSFCRIGRHSPSYGHSVGPRAPEGPLVTRLELVGGAMTVELTEEDLLAVYGPLGLGVRYVSHLSWAPGGARFAFLAHLESQSGAAFTDLVVRDGNRLERVAREKVSHFCWLDDTRLIAWCRSRESVGAVKHALGESRLMRVARHLSRRIRVKRLRRSLYGEAFRILDVHGHTLATQRSLVEDGHPQVSPSADDRVVVDAYPDPEGCQRLFVHAVDLDRVVQLAVIYSNPLIRETGWRCDLHPRWDRDGRRVAVDAALGARRQLVVFDATAALDSLDDSAPPN